MTPTTLTFEQFTSLPDEPGKQELLHGELILLPPASERHNRIVHRIFLLIHQHVTPTVRMEAGYRLDAITCVQPDVSIPHEGQPAGVYFEGGPLLAIEVISPANTASDMQQKVRLYLASGTREVWLVYPVTRTVEVHYAQGSTTFAQAFDSAILDLTVEPAEIFGE